MSNFKSTTINKKTQLLNQFKIIDAPFINLSVYDQTKISKLPFSSKSIITFSMNNNNFPYIFIYFNK